jgi:hypothetical protein
VQNQTDGQMKFICLAYLHFPKPQSATIFNFPGHKRIWNFPVGSVSAGQFRSESEFHEELRDVMGDTCVFVLTQRGAVSPSCLPPRALLAAVVCS